MRPGFVWSGGPSPGLRPPSPGGSGVCGLRPGFVWSVGPHPAFGHPLPGGEGSRIASRVCLVRWSLTRPSATLFRGRGLGCVPGCWRVHPASASPRGRGCDCVPGLFGPASPGLRPPSPGERGSWIASRVCLVRWPLTRPSATLCRGERGLRIASRVCLVRWPLTRRSATLCRGERSLWIASRVCLVRWPLTRPSATLCREERGLRNAAWVPLEIAAYRSAGLSCFPNFHG